MIIHINLISHQLLPNVISTLVNWEQLHQHQAMKVILIQGDDALADKTQTLYHFYQHLGINDIEIQSCHTSMDYARLYQHAKNLFERLRAEHPDAMLALNATGGTKPMSIAFTQVFDQLEQQSMVIYTDTEHQKITILNPNADKLPSLPYHSVLDIENYLYLNNFQLNSLIDNQSLAHEAILARKTFSQYLLVLFEKHRGLLKMMNALCQQTNMGHPFTPFCPNVILKSAPKDKFHDLLTACQQQGLLTFTDIDITFSNKESACYLGGHWLEELVYCTAIDAGIEHVAMSIEGSWDNSALSSTTQAENELDVVLVHNNQMMLIECKTLDWQQHNLGQSVTLKLDSLHRKLGGSLSQGMLISVCELGAKNQQRIDNSRNLTSVMGSQLHQLEQQITAWRERIS
ncbi:TPA: Card1-like endonuclease domain-containing protein [Photobacterium damselae]